MQAGTDTDSPFSFPRCSVRFTDMCIGATTSVLHALDVKAHGAGWGYPLHKVKAGSLFLHMYGGDYCSAVVRPDEHETPADMEIWSYLLTIGYKWYRAMLHGLVNWLECELNHRHTVHVDNGYHCIDSRDYYTAINVSHDYGKVHVHAVRVTRDGRHFAFHRGRRDSAMCTVSSCTLVLDGVPRRDIHIKMRADEDDGYAECSVRTAEFLQLLLDAGVALVCARVSGQLERYPHEIAPEFTEEIDETSVLCCIEAYTEPGSQRLDFRVIE